MKTKHLLSLAIIALMASYVSAGYATAEASSAADIIVTIACSLMVILKLASASIAALIIVLQGIKWITSAEDPGARKAAKAGIVHAIIGLIIIILAIALVSLVVTGQSHLGTTSIASC